MSESVIVICAAPATAHAPTLSPRLPIASNEHASTRIDASVAGASITHLPGRKPETGQAAIQPETISQFLHITTVAQ